MIRTKTTDKCKSCKGTGRSTSRARGGECVQNDVRVSSTLRYPGLPPLHVRKDGKEICQLFVHPSAPELTTIQQQARPEKSVPLSQPAPASLRAVRHSGSASLAKELTVTERKTSYSESGVQASESLVKFGAKTYCEATTSTSGIFLANKDNSINDHANARPVSVSCRPLVSVDKTNNASGPRHVTTLKMRGKEATMIRGDNVGSYVWQSQKKIVVDNVSMGLRVFDLNWKFVDNTKLSSSARTQSSVAAAAAAVEKNFPAGPPPAWTPSPPPPNSPAANSTALKVNREETALLKSLSEDFQSNERKKKFMDPKHNLILFPVQQSLKSTVGKDVTNVRKQQQQQQQAHPTRSFPEILSRDETEKQLARQQKSLGCLFHDKLPSQ